MRIESISIRNFKNLLHVEMERLPDLVVLAGPNGSGKTSLFSALRIFKEAIAGYTIGSKYSNNYSTILREVGQVITFGESEARIAVKIRASPAEREVLELPEAFDGLFGATVLLQHGDRPNHAGLRITDHSEYYDHFQMLLGEGMEEGSALGIVDHIGSTRAFDPSEVTNLQFSEGLLELPQFGGQQATR